MTKEEMLSAIYNEMADKTLSEWCIVFNKVSWTNDIVWNIYITFDDKLIEPRFDRLMEKDEYKIIWHPVRIGDVLDWFDKNNPEHLWWWNWVINGEIIVREWNNLRLPIDEQSDECIEFIYNLIKK